MDEPTPDSPLDLPPWLAVLERQQSRASKERAHNTEAFTKALDRQTEAYREEAKETRKAHADTMGGFRKEMRWMGIGVIVLVALALGRSVYMDGTGAITISGEPAPMSAAAATPDAAALPPPSSPQPEE